MRGILLTAFFLMGPSAAQNLVISNARIIDGTGAVIEQGTLTVQGGEIVSIGVEGAAASQATQLNANGMTVMPGMIDTHVHLSNSPDMYRSARAFLELGFTTIADNAGHIGMLSELRDQIATQNSGPRILISGTLVGVGNHPVSTVCRLIAAILCEDGIEEVSDPVEAREIVRRYAESDVDAIKVIYQDNPPGTMLADDVLLAISQEAEQLGLPLIVHAPIASDALRAVELGADRMAHSPVQPVTGAVDIQALGRTLVQSSIPVATTARGQPTRDRNFPLEERLAGIRELWDAGVTIAFGTDTGRPDPNIRLQIEALSRILSPDELLTALTRNAAAYLGLDSEIGTLEAGKRADIVILDADPLADVSALERVRIVIKDGRVVVDNR